MVPMLAMLTSTVLPGFIEPAPPKCRGTRIAHNMECQFPQGADNLPANHFKMRQLADLSGIFMRDFTPLPACFNLTRLPPAL